MAQPRRQLGNYVPSYCGGLTYGNIEDLQSLIADGLASGKHRILARLAEDDMAGLLELSKDHGYMEKEGYYSKCHICLDLRTHLHESGEFPELKPDEFYERIRIERGG
ncbi:MAG: hypothetical protein ACLFVS_06425 [Candidatus Acetothermia bacterium]